MGPLPQKAVVPRCDQHPLHSLGRLLCPVSSCHSSLWPRPTGSDPPSEPPLLLLQLQTSGCQQPPWLFSSSLILPFHFKSQPNICSDVLPGILWSLPPCCMLFRLSLSPKSVEEVQERLEIKHTIPNEAVRCVFIAPITFLSRRNCF